MTHAVQVKEQPIDWYDVKMIADSVFTLKRLRDADDSRMSRVGDMLRPQPGQTLALEVVVSDADLAQAVLCSMYGDEESLIPGMQLTKISFDSDPDGRKRQVQMLRELADQMEADIHNEETNPE